MRNSLAPSWLALWPIVFAPLTVACDDPPKESPEVAQPQAEPAGEGGVLKTNVLSQAKIETACLMMAGVQSAGLLYQVQKGKCAPSTKVLEEQGMVAEDKPDPWGKPFLLECKEDRLIVRSGGPDGVLGNADDLAVGETGKTCGGAKQATPSKESKAPGK